MVTDARSLLNVSRRSRLLTSVDFIDSSLAKGLPTGGVFEIVGPASTGKSELLLQAAVQTISPDSFHGVRVGGASAGIIFIDLDGHFSVVRVVGLLEGRFRKAGVALGDIQDAVHEALRRLTLIRCHSLFEFLCTVLSLESLFRTDPENALVLVDGISAFHWLTAVEGSALFEQCCVALDSLMQDHKIGVMASRAALFPSDQGRQDSYLGASWSRLVVHRLHTAPAMEPSADVSDCVAWFSVFEKHAVDAPLYRFRLTKVGPRENCVSDAKALADEILC